VLFCAFDLTASQLTGGADCINTVVRVLVSAILTAVDVIAVRTQVTDTSIGSAYFRSEADPSYLEVQRLTKASV
jgi:hypothetical protein